MSSFFDKIRASDVQTRKKWMVVFSIIAAAVIFIIWIFVMKMTMETASLKANEKNVLFAASAQSVYDATIGTVKSVVEKFFSKISGERTIDIMK